MVSAPEVFDKVEARKQKVAAPLVQLLKENVAEATSLLDLSRGSGVISFWIVVSLLFHFRLFAFS